MARENVGEYDHECGKVAAVRRDRNGRLYLNCPNCGLAKYNAPGGQDLILTKARMYGPEGKPEPKPEPKPAPPAAKPPAAPPPPAAPRRPMFSTLLDI